MKIQSVIASSWISLLPFRGRGLLLFCLLSSVFGLHSCTSIPHIPSHATTGLTRIQLSKEWAQIGPFLFHSNGTDWIEFDSIAHVSIQPTSIRVIGYRPVYHGTHSSTHRPTGFSISAQRKSQQTDTSLRPAIPY